VKSFLSVSFGGTEATEDELLAEELEAFERDEDEALCVPELLLELLFVLVAEEPDEEPVEESAEESAEEPAEESVAELVAESPEELAEELPEELTEPDDPGVMVEDDESVSPISPGGGTSIWGFS